ncbi:MAG: electron transfer flavoprotein subunit alpha/FixB family protein [Deltaproteobacteria bacterium]|nr:electron transfer flavoprotein subunit alpha/FixB family protein [Deltaproteobacteria bacterium]
MSVWVVAEHRDGEVREVTRELLSAVTGFQLGPVTAVVLAGAGKGEALARLLNGAVPRVFVAESPWLDGFNGTAVAQSLAALARDRSPSLILGAHSAAGMDWAPALAARLGAPSVTDAVKLGWEGGQLWALRAFHGGKLQARLRLDTAPTVVATLRPGSTEGFSPAWFEATIVEEVGAELPSTLGKRFLRWIQEAAGEVDITQADVLVSVGRGIGDKENLDVPEKLAKALGATLSCSRPVVDMRWLPKMRQVGISGKTVKPKVYIALGISGAFQHVAAMKGAGTIIAVNKDPKAPIFQVAHYGIVGDLFKIVPALTGAVDAARASA